MLTTIDRRGAGSHDVLIEIRYAGICHSDIHTVRGDWGDWGRQQYPLVPGHEIAGIVTKVVPVSPNSQSATGWVWAAWSTHAASA